MHTGKLWAGVSPPPGSSHLAQDAQDDAPALSGLPPIPKNIRSSSLPPLSLLLVLLSCSAPESLFFPSAPIPGVSLAVGRSRGGFGGSGVTGSPRGCDSAAATARRVRGTPRCPLCVPHTPNPSTSASGGPRGLQSPNWGRRGPELGEPWGGCTAPAMPRTIPPPWEAGGKTGEERERLRGGGRDPLGSLEWHQEPPGTSGTSGHLVLPGAAAELRDGAWGGSGGLLPSPRAGIREFRVGSSSPTAPRGCFSTRNVGAEAPNIPRGCNPTFPARSQLSSGWAGRCSRLPAPPEGVPVWSRFFVPAPPGEGGRNERESLFAEILEVKKKRDL